MSHSNEIFSSPDPLGESQENIGVVSLSKQRREKTKLTPTKPLTNTSNNVQRQEFYLATPSANRTSNGSPFKLVAEAENPISPWRIRVTVEAEQENAQQGHSRKRFAERTTTTTIPLRDADEQSPTHPKKGRGRPRKSNSSPVKSPATPKSKAPARRKTMPESSSKTANGGGRRSSTSAKKARGITRKSTEHLAEESASQDSYLAHAHGPDQNPNSKTIQKTPCESEGNRTGTTSIDAHPSPNSTSQDNKNKSHTGLDDAEYVESADTREDGIDGHSYLQDPTDQHQEFDSILESEGFSMVSVSSLPSAKLDSNSVLEPEMNREYDESDDRRTVEHPSLNDPENMRNTQDLCSLEIASPPSSPSSSLASPLKIQKPKQDQTQSIMSPPTSIPSNMKSPASRKFPRPLDKLSDDTPKLARVVRAGIALQGVLSPRNIRSVPGKGPVQEASSGSPPSAKSPKERLDRLFSGFSAGTMRELRAGLRLGEELAKRQQNAPRQHLATCTPEDDVFGQNCAEGYPRLPSHCGPPEYRLKLPGPSQKTLYPILMNSQLPSPERSEVDNDDDRMSWRVDTPESSRAPNVETEHYSRDAASTDHDSKALTAAREEALRLKDEVYWREKKAQDEEDYRLERLAVIRQIEMANSSQVIVINSDSEEDDEFDSDDGDIWQEQAHSSGVVMEAEDEVPAILLLNKAPQPRRSLIPSPWRRHHELSSLSHVSMNDSDLFWQPSQKANSTGKSKKLDEILDQALKLSHSPTSSIIHSSDVINQKDAIDQPESMPSNRLVSHDIHPVETLGETKKPQKAFAAVLDKGKIYETWEARNTEIENRKEYASQELVAEVGSNLPRSAPEASPAKNTVITVLKKPSKKSGLAPNQCVKGPVSTSWFSYLTSFVPTWREPTPAAPFRLPNGKHKLPHPGSLEGPLCLYTPWTTAHWDALYFHYAASKEGRRHYQFNPKSASAPYLGFVHKRRLWEKELTEEDLAIVDAFMVDLKARGDWKHFKGEKRIDEKLAGEKVFRLWYGGVLRGECEVGIGKTGLMEKSDEMWKPETESWYQKKK